MISLVEVEKIMQKLTLCNNTDFEHQLSKDVSYIAYRVDCFKYNSTNIISAC